MDKFLILEFWNSDRKNFLSLKTQNKKDGAEFAAGNKAKLDSKIQTLAKLRTEQGPWRRFKGCIGRAYPASCDISSLGLEVDAKKAELQAENLGTGGTKRVVERYESKS